MCLHGVCVLGLFNAYFCWWKKVQVKVTQSCPAFATPWTVKYMEFSRPESLEWVAFPFSRGSSNPGIKPRSPTLQAAALPAEAQGKPISVGGWWAKANLPKCDFSVGSLAASSLNIDVVYKSKYYTHTSLISTKYSWNFLRDDLDQPNSLFTVSAYYFLIWM